MKTVYTTTITAEALRRGIGIRVLDAALPIFELRHGGRSIRCYNALTDHVGAATFHLAQNKHAANGFLRAHGFPVPAQERFIDLAQAERFLRRWKSIVVKPCTQWGGRGVSVAVRTPRELRRAIKRAQDYEEMVALEQCVPGIDLRLILVNYRYVAAIQRHPAAVVGTGRHTIATLIRRHNQEAVARDASNRIPLDEETRRNLASWGLSLHSVPKAGRRVQVRRTTNYHTGGMIDVVTGQVDKALVREATRIARSLRIPVIGIDFLVDRKSGRHWVVELSPDLAISPPEGEEVARHFLDYLFPETRQ